jgi:hypothetical protein
LYPEIRQNEFGVEELGNRRATQKQGRDLRIVAVIISVGVDDGDHRRVDGRNIRRCKYLF